MMFKLSANHKEFSDVVTDIKKSLSQADIISVVRVQNIALHHNFQYSKNQISEKHDIPMSKVEGKIANLFFSTTD